VATIQRFTREALNKAGSMRLQWKMDEFKAKIAGHSTAMAQIFNAEIVQFTCRITNHALFSASLGVCRTYEESTARQG